jgi:hypothetical protein
MSKPQRDVDSARAGSRYWLLLALLLFIASQLLAAEHRHADRIGFHGDCAVCVLSAAGGAAAIDSAWRYPLPMLAAIYLHRRGGRSRPAAIRFCDSRAPPLH